MATHSKLEALSNIAVIVAAVALCVVLVRNQWPSAQPGSPAALEGSTINIASLISAPAKRNLVMVLSQTCHFCEKEMPFYRSLGELDLAGKASLVVVFPPNEPEPAKFLAARSVRADHVVNSPLSGLQIPGTPTLLLVDAKGKVERAWVGALPPDKHKEVLESLQSQT
jgi:thioredoxin-related protein